MVFSHHPHEIFATGMLLEYRPDLLFLSHAHGYKKLEVQAKAGLDAIGFQGTVQFLEVSERVAYERLLESDFEWFRSMRDQVVEWLLRVRPTAVFSDAFECYNPIHDLCSLMVDSALKTIKPNSGFVTPQRFEFPLAFGAKPGAIISASSDPEHRVIAHELTDEQIFMKRKRCGLLIRDVPPDANVSDHPAKIVAGLHPDLFRREFFAPLPQDRNYWTAPPAGPWKTYDEHGRERVAAGRFARALTFAEHFAPMARSLFEASEVSPLKVHAA